MSKVIVADKNGDYAALVLPWDSADGTALS